MAHSAAKMAREKAEHKTGQQTEAIAQKAFIIAEVAEAIDNEFNNLMMAVTGYAELELKKASPAARRPLEQVLRNSTRATYLVQKLLSLSRNHSGAPQQIDINDVISGLADILRSLLGEKTALTLQLEHGVGEVLADPIELERLLIASVLHARRSMSGVQKLYIATKASEFPNHDAQPESRSAVMISISDSEKAKSSPASTWNVIEPNNNESTLAVEAVAQSAGATCVFGESNGARRFAVHFAALKSHSTVTNQIETGAAASKTVLIVDDDDSVRLPAVEFLKMEGFKVLQAKTGSEAINIVMQKRSPVDLLITDVLMPAMNGDEVAAKLTEMHLGLKVLYMSGDSGGAARAKNILQKDILHKPFRLDNLNQKIQALLHSSNKGGDKTNR